MEVKLIEIRDAGTFIPVMAVRLIPTCEEERYLFGRSGYGVDPENQGTYILIIRLAGGNGQATCDPYEWGGAPMVRTMPEAHKYIIEHWYDLKTGDVVDVEFALGESEKPKLSERITA
ncbi:MAG: hypothetical protein WBC82_11155 [Dehalococcoidia bacterium]